MAPIATVKIYGRNQCHFCNAAQALCDKWSVDYEYMNIEFSVYLNELFLNYGDKIGVNQSSELTECPYIIFYGKYIGHYDDLLKKIEENIGAYSKTQ